MNFNLKTAQDVELELKRQAQIIEDIEFLHNLQFCFQVYEIIKATDIKEVKIDYIKNEYNDEGLECGVYFDYKTKNVNFCNTYLDDSLEYMQKIGESWGDSQFSEEEEKELEINQNALLALNSLASDLYGAGEKLSYLIEDLEGKVLSNNIDKMVQEVCGKNGLDKWKIAIEKASINEAVPIVKKPSIKSKKIKL